MVKHLLFYLLDNNKRLKSAHDLGQIGLPPREASSECAQELEIVHDATDLVEQAYADASQTLADILAKLKSVSPAAIHSVLIDLPADAKRQGEITIASLKGVASRLAHRVHEAERALQYFAATHGVSRDPTHGSVRARIWGHWFVLGLAFLLETWANSVFWNPLLADGVAAGLVMAGILSLVNLLPAILAGDVFARHALHGAGWTRIFARAAFAAWMVCTLLYNLSIARYRNAAEAGIDPGTLSDGLAVAVLHPFDISNASYQSLLLAAVGLLMAGFTAVKSYLADDVIPRYGGLGRRKSAAQKGLDATLAHVARRYEKMVVDSADADSGAKRPPRAHRVYTHRADIAREAAVQMVEQTRDRGAHAEAVADAAADEYRKSREGLKIAILHWRAANTRTRGPEPVPAYFGRPAILPLPPKQALVAAHLAQIKAEIARIREEAAGIDQDHALCVAELKQLPRGFYAYVAQLRATVLGEPQTVRPRRAAPIGDLS